MVAGETGSGKSVALRSILTILIRTALFAGKEVIQMSKKIMSKVATLLSAFAVISVKPASVLYIYKGETPKELLK